MYIVKERPFSNVIFQFGGTWHGFSGNMIGYASPLVEFFDMFEYFVHVHLIAESYEKVVVVFVMFMNEVGPQWNYSSVFLRVTLVTGCVRQIVATEKGPSPRNIQTRNKKAKLLGGITSVTFFVVIVEADAVVLPFVCHILFYTDRPLCKVVVELGSNDLSIDDASVSRIVVFGKIENRIDHVRMNKENISFPGAIDTTVQFYQRSNKRWRKFHNFFDGGINMTLPFMKNGVFRKKESHRCFSIVGICLLH